MMKINIRTILFILCTIMMSATAVAQESFSNKVEFDKTIHDFGDVSLADGPLGCSYNIKNISSKPLAIYNVTTTCGCTDVKWTREPLKPGASGKIEVVYSNDEGPYPFNKSITVYVSGIDRPITLRLRGIAHAKKKPLEDMFPIKSGPLGFKDTKIKCGNIEQGGKRSDSANIANLSDNPVKVTFSDVSKNLTISCDPAVIPPRSTAKVKFTVSSDRNLWGKNWYNATPVANGKVCTPLAIWAFTKENFNNITAEEKDKGPRPMLEASTFNFGKIKRGRVIQAEYTIKNTGKTDFKVYKIDSDSNGIETPVIPEIKPKASHTFKINVDTSKLPLGETLVLITLTTNSPSRPIINIFVTGWLE